MARNPRRTRRKRSFYKRDRKKPQKTIPCDGCSACCMVLKVEAVAKDQYTRCNHQCAIGCGIYRTRPAGCEGFHCLYELGMIDGGVDARPDNLGLLLYFQTNRFGHTVMVNEVWSGAIEENLSLIDGLRKFSVMILIPYGGQSRRVVGPDSEMQRLAEMVEEVKTQKGVT